MRRAALEASFRATTYRVTVPEGFFCLRIGVAHPAFDSFLLHRAPPTLPLGEQQREYTAGVCWGIVTAYNPGLLRSEDDNRLAQARLYERIAASGWPFLAACNLADGGSWPEEPSYLLLAETAEVASLGREFGQVAVVCGRTREAPQLIWL